MLRTIHQAGNFRNKAVILRCDFNVPLSDGRVSDDGRIRAALPTIEFLTNAGAKLVIISHLGRPDGSPAPKYSLKPVAERLSELLGKPVRFVSEAIGPIASEAVSDLQGGELALLENLRFDPREASKNPNERNDYASELALLGDIFVSDGFGVVHREQASVFELAKLLPSYAGLLIESELKVLEDLTISPTRPYTVVLGGSKVSDKLGVIQHLLPKVDRLLIGGGMLFSFLAAKGLKIGKSLLEEDQLTSIQGFLSEADRLGVSLVLPEDVVVASKFAPDADFEVVGADAIESTRFGSEGIGLDIGPRGAELFSSIIKDSKTVFWNGPMGVFEFDHFAQGTRSVAQAMTEVDGISVVGGGDSAAAVRKLGFSENAFTHISTGGGASLEFLEGKLLPGLEVLND
jgi:phosphoglycerate kinase